VPQNPVTDSRSQKAQQKKKRPSPLRPRESAERRNNNGRNIHLENAEQAETAERNSSLKKLKTESGNDTEEAPGPVSGFCFFAGCFFAGCFFALSSCCFSLLSSRSL
jgi:hypothetical protein